jgi:hypothetical protein
MKPIQIQSEVGKDGVLSLRVPIGSEEAGHLVIVTIEPATGSTAINFDRGDWHQFVEENYGSCAGRGLERPDQGEYEIRENIE